MATEYINPKIERILKLYNVEYNEIASAFWNFGAWHDDPVGFIWQGGCPFALLSVAKSKQKEALLHFDAIILEEEIGLIVRKPYLKTALRHLKDTLRSSKNA